jgi:hypothetical protein
MTHLIEEIEGYHGLLRWLVLALLPESRWHLHFSHEQIVSLIAPRNLESILTKIHKSKINLLSTIVRAHEVVDQLIALDIQLLQEIDADFLRHRNELALVILDDAFAELG